jgi:hypothetical protein
VINGDAMNNNDIQNTETTFRSRIDAIANEAAHAAWDAHQREIPAQVAWDFITQLFYETEDARGVGLPERMPAEFAHDFRRYTAAIRDGNPFA